MTVAVNAHCSDSIVTRLRLAIAGTAIYFAAEHLIDGIETPDGH
jgi:hypothetical protein